MKHRAPRTLQAGRQLWPDVVKGMCIILIVLWHVVSKHFWFLDGQAGVPPSDFWRWFVEALQPLRMPLFFVIAGMFAVSAVARPLTELVRTRIAKFAYLYVVWLLIHTAVMWFTPQVKTAHAQNVSQLIELITISPTNLWFLYALAAYFAVARLVRPLPRAWVLGAAMAVSAATSAQLVGDAGNRWQVVQNFVFFLVGLYGRDLLQHLARVANGRLLLATSIVYAASTAAMYGAGAQTWFGVWPVVSLIGITLGIVAAALTARHARRTTAVLVHLGSRTLPIYVIHLPLFAVLEQLAHHYDVEPTSGIYLAVGPIVITAAIVCGCLGLERVLRRLNADFLLEPPFVERPRMPTAA